MNTQATAQPERVVSLSIEPNAIYTAQEAARLLALHPRTVEDKLRAGVIKGSQRIGRWRVRGSELLKFA